MIKKIVSITLALIMVLSYAVYAAEEKGLYAEEFARLGAYNIMAPLDEESMKNDITQLQFREALAAIAGEDKDLLARADSFGEVYDANGSVTLIKAVISLVKLVGYSDDAIQKGGTYNSGYMGIAASCGILKGISGVGENDPISYAQAGKLIYNALNVPLCKVVFKGTDIYYETDKDKTLMSEYLSFYEVKGVVNATSDYALPGYSKMPEGEIMIGDMSYTINSNSFNSFFGMDVAAYYRYDEDNDESKIVRMTPRREGSVTVIPAPDITGYENGRYTYENDEMTREKSVTVSSGAQWYYNYQAVVSRELAEEMEYIPDVGSVTLIDNNNDAKADVVIIEDYDVRIADYVRDDVIITKNGGGKILTDNETKITDKDRNRMDQALMIGTNSVVHTIFAKDGVTAEHILVTSDAAEGTVRSINRADNTILFADGTEYGISKSKSSITDEIKNGMNITVYLDINGRIAGYKSGVTGDLMFGYLVEFKTFESDETGEEVVRLKVFDVEEKSIKTLYTAEKFKVNEETYNTKRYADIASDFHDQKGVLYDQLIRYKLNKDEQVTEIDTAYDGDENLDPSGAWGLFPAKRNGLVKVAGAQLLKETGQSMASTPENERDRARLPYWVNRYGISRRYIMGGDDPANDWSMNMAVPGDATVLYVPKNRNSGEEYYVTTRSAWNMNGEIVLDTYRVENESELPSFIVAYAGNGAAEFAEASASINNPDLIDAKATPALIVDISQVWDEKTDSSSYQVKMLYMGAEKNLYITNEDWITTLEYEVKNKQSGADLGKVTGLHPGDVIKFAEGSDTITAIEMFAPISMIKDYNMDNWKQLSRGIMNNGGYFGYAYARFDNGIMCLKAPKKAQFPSTIKFDGTDVFMVSGLDVFDYDYKRRTFEKSDVECINFYTGMEDIKKTSVVMVFGDGAEIKNNCIYVINNLSK